MTAGGERAQKRLRLQVPVFYYELSDDGTQPAEQQGKLRDLSAGGCAFYLPHDVPVGTRIHLRITLNEELSKKLHKTELTAKGAVVRAVHEKDEYVISVRFTH